MTEITSSAVTSSASALRALLPQYASQEQQARRVHELKKAQEKYIYESPDSIPKVPFIKGPVEELEAEKPSALWKLKYAFISAKKDANFSLLDIRSCFSAVGKLFNAALGRTKVDFAIDSGRAKRIAEKVDRSTNDPKPGDEDFEERSPLLQSYRKLFGLLPLPSIANVFMEDSIFARLRVAGYNPMSIFKVTTEQKMPFAIEDSALPGDDKIMTAIQEDRLYALDFSFLNDLQQEADPDKSFAVSKALFVISTDRTCGRGDLTPVAIEVDGDVVLPPSAEGKRFSARWEIAKLALNSCDMVHHQLIAHLSNCHLLMEPFIAATRRQLSTSHPVYRLLTSHFEGTAFINERAALDLITPGGPVDRILAGDLASGIQITGKYFLGQMEFNSLMPDVELESRGLMSDKLFMPYREDALSHWKAIMEFVSDYLSLFYQCDEDIKGDYELKAWADELVHPHYGKVRYFGNYGDGVIHDIQYLVRALSHVIFTASVQHAAVNFPQSSTMIYTPAVPGYLWGELPGPTDQVGVNEWRRILLPIDKTIEQMEVFTILGGVHHTQLGQYYRGVLPQTASVQGIVDKYQKKLKEIEDHIAAREETEVVKYEFLRPSLIPQSINI